jgi:site-specific recombinase XerD
MSQHRFSEFVLPSRVSRVRIPSPARQLQVRKNRVPAFSENKYEALVLESLLLNRVADYYLKSLGGERKSPRTIEAYLFNLDLFMKHAGRIKLSDVQAAHVRLFLADRAADHAGSTTHQAFRVLRTFFRWCVREGFLERTPMANIQAPVVEKKVIESYTRDDIHALLSACNQKQFTGARNIAMISLFLDTGLRAGELTHLSIDNIDFETGRLKVRGKGSKERVIPFGEKARKALWKYMILRDLKASLHETTLLLSEELRPMTRTGLLTTIRKIAAAAGVRKANLHKFRHTFAIEYLRNQGDLATLQYILGHTNINTTMRYLSSLGLDDAARMHSRASPGNAFLL